MLPVPFSFSGRIARWPYAKGCLALVAAAILPIVLALGALPSIRAGSSSAMIALAVLFVIFAVVMFWISLTLQVRRCRDIGWSPLVVIPAWFALQFADPFLAHLLPRLATGTHHDQTVIGIAVNLFMVVSLTFWPSSDEEDSPSAPIRGLQRPVALAPSPAPLAVARSAPLPMRPTFGRR